MADQNRENPDPGNRPQQAERSGRDTHKEQTSRRDREEAEDVGHSRGPGQGGASHQRDRDRGNQGQERNRDDQAG